MNKGFELLENLLKNADKSKSGLRKLNWVLARVIPFNSPHRIKISKISNERVEAILPFRKRNMNHLKSLHAAAIMTVGEFCSGIWLMKRIGSKYRLIMKSCEIEYFKQGRSDAKAVYDLSDEDWQLKIAKPLKSDGVVQHLCEVNVLDKDENLLALVHVKWQIKDWSQVGKRNPSS